MRVLIVRLFSQKENAIGGAEQTAVLHAQALKNNGHEARALTNFSYKNDKLTKRVHISRHKILGQLQAFIIFPLQTLRYKPDVVNPHSRFDQIALSLTKWLHRRPVVWKDPGELVHAIQPDRTGALAKLNQKLYIAAIKKADAIYTLDEKQMKKILDNLHVLGVKGVKDTFISVRSDISFDDYDLTIEPHPTDASLVIGSISRLDKNKGIQYLIEAFRVLDIADSELWIIGDGPYRSHLEKLANNQHTIRFWGYQVAPSEYLKRIDILVQPSEYEGWGRNVKEGMYFSKPVVGSNTGGIATQIDDGKTGLLFEPKNTKELVSALKKLIENPALCTQIGKNAKEYVDAQGDFNALMRNEIIPLFQKAISR